MTGVRPDGTKELVWAAVRDVWPKTREQRDWFREVENVLDKLPKRLQPRVKALHEVMYAETRAQAREAVTRCRHPKARAA
jgi:transposase-like protein